jgi:hypothetical protein
MNIGDIVYVTEYHACASGFAEDEAVQILGIEKPMMDGLNTVYRCVSVSRPSEKWSLNKEHFYTKPTIGIAKARFSLINFE